MIHQAMKARSWTPEEGWSWKGSPGRDKPFQADTGMLLCSGNSHLHSHHPHVSLFIISDSDFPSCDIQCIQQQIWLTLLETFHCAPLWTSSWLPPAFSFGDEVVFVTF